MSRAAGYAWGLAAALALGAVPAGGAEAPAVDSGPERLSRNGRAALEDGQYELAEKLFRQWLEAVPAGTPAAADARVFLARAAYGRKAFREMLDDLPRSECPRPGQLHAAAYRYYRALALFESGSLDEALVELGEPGFASDSNPVATDTLRLRAWIFLKQAKWSEADRMFKAWSSSTRLDPGSGAHVAAWAGALTAAGRFAESAAVLRDALERKQEQPLEWRFRYELARALAGQGEPAAAGVELAPLLATSVVNSIRMDAWLLLAGLEEGRTNWPGAWAAASNAVALASEPAAARRAKTTLGRLYLRGGALNEGAELLKEAIAESPADPQAPLLQLAVARAFLDSGRAAEAEANYRYYLESFTNAAGVAEAQEGRAWALFGLERYAEAAAGYEKAAAAAADPVRRNRLIYKAGDACLANRQYQLASEAYRRVIESGADSAMVREARFQMAETDAKQGKIREAQEAFAALERAAAGTDLAERAALRAAELSQDTGSLIPAKEAYDRFLSVYSNSLRTATALYNRGLVCYQIYQFGQALDDFEAVAKRHPDSPHAENAAYMRVCGAFELYNDERAERLAREFIEFRPRSTWVPQVRFRLAEYAFNRASYEEAEKEFLAVSDGYPKDPLAGDSLFWAARAAAARKQFKRAIEYDTRLVKEYPDNRKATEAVFFQAEALVELGDYAGALVLFDEVIRRQPDSFLAFAARGRRGDCQFTLGTDDSARFEDAIRSYHELAEDGKAPFELRLQAAFKIGRGQQKLGRTDEAFEQYYTRVILAFLDARQAGRAMNESCTAWFTRAAFEAAAIQESKGQWRRAVRLYQRVVDAAVPAADDARRRIESIQREHWRFF